MRVASQVFLLLLSALATQASEGVVLLHGLCRTKNSMGRLEAALARAGYCVENAGYHSRTATVQELSDEVIVRALSSPRLASCAKVHFVTHSLGGLLVRSYFNRHRDPRLGRVVMLGPPNQGSEVVDFLRGWWVFQKFNGPAGLELGTEKGSTPNQLGRVEFDLGVIAGDRSINWINSILIEGPDDGKVSVERTQVEGMRRQLIVHVAHPFLMGHRKVIEHTIGFLKNGEFDLENVSGSRRRDHLKSI